MPHRTRQHWIAVSAALLAVVVATVSAAVMSARAESATAAASRTAKPSSSSSASSRTSPSATATATAPARELQIGMDYGDSLTFASTSVLDSSLDDAVAVGAGWIRVDLAWEDYQPFAADPPSFAKFDKVVTAANARGLKILATVGFPAPWARKAGCTNTSDCPPASTTAFAQFAHAAAAHLAPMGVHDWEIWNEPNIGAWAPTPDPAAYTHLLTTTVKSIRQADAHAYVLLGGLAAAAPGPGAPYFTAYDFITAVGRDGGLKSVDAVSYHPYPDSGAIATANAFQAISGKPQNIAEALAEQGVPDMPIWITETGADIPEQHFIPPDPVKLQTQVDQQAAVATAMIPYLAANAHVASMFWFNDKDVPDLALFFGLRKSDGTARPSFDALQKAVAAYKRQFAQPR